MSGMNITTLGSGGGSKPLKYVTGVGSATIPIPRNKCKRLYGSYKKGTATYPLTELFPILTMPIGAKIDCASDGVETHIYTTVGWFVVSETSNSFTLQRNEANELYVWYE